MKTIIIRKPKFMRSDDVMKTYIDVAATISKEACRPETNLDQKVDMLRKTSECLNKAAKAGGFFSVGDMCKWLTAQQ